MTDIVERLEAIDHMNVEECFLDSHLYAEAAATIRALCEALVGVREHFDGTRPDKDWMETERLVRTALRSIAAPKQDAEPVAWRHIGTIPQDGTRVLVGRFTGEQTNHDGLVQVDYWHSREKGQSYDGLGKFNKQFWPATHWAPIPTAPEPTP